LIAPRADRRGLLAARPVLIVGMAPSRSGNNLDGPTFERLAGYAGVTLAELLRLTNVVNLLPEWPGEADSPKWDDRPDKASWEVGQRASLLMADLHERPRTVVVLLGDYVRSALEHWGGPEARVWLEPTAGPRKCTWVTSPHPAGTNMWWNDPANLAAGRAFWRTVIAASRKQLPRPPQKVDMTARSRWLFDLIERVGPDGWPKDMCVDWPWVDPKGRPTVYLRGEAVPTTHVVLESAGLTRPGREYQALHSCDRGIEGCLNLRHLRWGTELENRLDQSDRGRGAIGRLGRDAAARVAARHKEFVEVLAAEHGVTTDTIMAVATGKSWSGDKWETT
jgi:hypothetical protein